MIIPWYFKKSNHFARQIFYKCFLIILLLVINDLGSLVRYDLSINLKNFFIRRQV